MMPGPLFDRRWGSRGLRSTGRWARLARATCSVTVFAALGGAIGALGSPATAEAATKRAKTRVAVIPLLVEGDVDLEVRNRINGQIKTALESGRYELVEGRPPGGTCRDYQCIRSVATQAKAQFVVVGSIATVQHDYGIAVFVYDAAGNLKSKEETTCEICSYDEAGEALVAKVEALKPTLIDWVKNPYGDREQERELETEPGTFVFRTDPKGAVVEIDGKKRGTTPLSTVVEPGLREVDIYKRGYAPLHKTVRAVSDERSQMDFTLVETNETQTKALRATGITFSILGIGMLGAGIPLLAIDESPYKDDCKGENVDFNGTCRYRYNTLLPGALLTAFGAAALVTGVTTGMIAFGRRKRTEKKSKSKYDDLDEDTISVTPIIGPTSAGLKVRF